MMDLVINHTAKDSLLVADHPDWFAREPGGAIRSPFAVDPDDTSRITVWGDLAEIDFAPRPARDTLVAWFAELVQHYARLGFRGFRCDAAYKVPAATWRTVIAAARAVDPGAVFAAETLGCTEEEALGLADCGFDYLFNSSKWWDFRSDWLLRQYDLYRRIAPTIAFPESHDTERLASELGRAGVVEPRQVEALYRQRYLFAAAFSSGVLMPMGYEFGFRRKLDVVTTRPDQWEAPLFDLTAFIGAVNRMKQALPVLNQEGPQIRATRPGVLPVGLLRRTDDGAERCLTLINPEASDHDPERPPRTG
jgi:starch synthase (maltosyl-transferring)